MYKLFGTLSHLLIYLIIYQYGLTDIYFVLWIIIQGLVFLIVPDLVIRSSVSWLLALCPYNIPSSFFFEYFFTFSHYKMFQGHCWRINHGPPPKDIHILIPGTCESYLLEQNKLCRCD